MPCSNKKARELLKQNKATIYSYTPFTIQLTDVTGETVQPISIGIDTGAKYLGIAITSEDKVLAKGEIELRQDVSSLMQTRKALRSVRRLRKTRYRPMRVLNRFRKEGWLPPSVKSRVDSTKFWIDKFVSLVPNAELHIEIAKFNIDNILNNSSDYYNTRYFVFARDDYTCQVCKKRKSHLRTHHIKYVSCGGTNRADNLITVCEDCHTSENHNVGGIFYKWMEANKRVKDYKAPTFMNIIAKRLQSTYTNTKFTYGNITTPRRIELGLCKTHYNDAIAISGIKQIRNNSDDYFYYKQFRKKKRSLHEQRPRKGLKQKNIELKRNCKNVKERNGFQLSEKVKFNGEVGWVYGFACGENGRYCVVRNIDGEIIRDPEHQSATYISMAKLEHMSYNNGWTYMNKNIS